MAQEEAAKKTQDPAKDAPKKDGRELRRLFAMVRPHRWRFYLATFSLLLGSGLGLLYPQAVRYAVDEGLKDGNYDTLNRIGLALLGIFIVQAVATFVRHYLMSWLGERVVSDLRRQVFTRLTTLSSSWYQERKTGELVGRLASDVTVVEGIVGSDLSIALRNFVTLLGGVSLLLLENAKLAGMMLILVPPLAVGVVIFGRKIRIMSRKVQDYLAETSAHVDETLSALTTVQAFGRESYEADRYGESVEATFLQTLFLAKWRSAFMSAVSFVGFFAIAAIVWLGGRAVIAGDITSGELTSFLLYTLMVSVSLGSLAGLWGNLQKAKGATERLFAIIDTIPDVDDVVDAKSLPNPDAQSAAVHFENVSFRYPSRPDQEVLHDVKLDIKPGEVVAIVGASGAGKSTLAQLLLRFFDVTEGRILLDGVDVRISKLEEVRGAIAIVSQEPVLLSGTIRENIAYAKLDASDDEIFQATKDAFAHDFILEFKKGYETLVGERGVKLSGGQRQRIAIARALLKNPRVLILDEATSSLDAKSEYAVQEAFSRLMRDRTTLVIAHRLSTVREADRICVLDQGRIVEEGKHDELMQAGGPYRELVAHQLIGAQP
ncbi:MAG: ATP-binding cassette domain-containing protein [Deltaproteobacteria bacterium]|nr:ATP-binding cassette domain-containing protein [Deltaproteobacteria bacterium]